jgi:hypothetical protein
LEEEAILGMESLEEDLQQASGIEPMFILIERYDS